MTDNPEFGIADDARQFGDADEIRADDEIAALRAEMQTAGLLPELPAAFEPTPESAAAMLARVKAMASPSAPPGIEFARSASIETTAPVPEPMTDQAVVSIHAPSGAHPTDEATAVVQVEPGLAPIPVATRSRWRSAPAIFGLAASILLAAAVAVPVVNRIGQPTATVVEADAPIQTEIQPLEQPALPAEPRAVQPEVTITEAWPRGGATPAGPLVVDPPFDATSVGWSGEPNQLLVTTWGSSSCPVWPEPMAEPDGAGVRIILLDPDDSQPCTADLAASSSVVEVPDGFDDGTDLRVLLDGRSGGEVYVHPRQIEGQPGPLSAVGQ